MSMDDFFSNPAVVELPIEDEGYMYDARKTMNAGELKAERLEMFKTLLALVEENKHVNQWK